MAVAAAAATRKRAKVCLQHFNGISRHLYNINFDFRIDIRNVYLFFTFAISFAFSRQQQQQRQLQLLPLWTVAAAAAFPAFSCTYSHGAAHGCQLQLQTPFKAKCHAHELPTLAVLPMLLLLLPELPMLLLLLLLRSLLLAFSCMFRFHIRNAFDRLDQNV